MKSKEIINKTEVDLSRLLGEKREMLRVFRFGGAGAKTKNVKQGRAVRKDIARIMTAMTANANK
ncbi:MAG: 50S ribosomal protein L29 [Candidatus Paceibacterota bacterium]|jgi:ribosomal protein L29